MRFYVLTAEVSMAVSWVLTPCGLVDGYPRFGETYCLHFQGEGGDSFSETLASTYESTRRPNPEEQHHPHRRKNLKSRAASVFSPHGVTTQKSAMDTYEWIAKCC
jgi:hypothetical protein